MEIKHTHYLNSESRTDFLNNAFARGVQEIPEFKVLNHILCSIEPNTLVLPMNNTSFEINRLIKRGEFFNGESTQIQGRISRCHENVIQLYKSNNNLKIVNGFALSDDGLWRFHSWLLDGTEIIETTEKRISYFGVVLSEEFKDLDDPLELENEIFSFIA